LSLCPQVERVFRFGAFQVDLQTGELRKNGTRLRLQEQPRKILASLLARPGELVTREQLIAALWPKGTFVDFDHGLNAAVKRLRTALNDSAERPRFIETVGSRGYRFIARVDQGDGAYPNLGAGPRFQAGPNQQRKRSTEVANDQKPGGETPAWQRDLKIRVGAFALTLAILFAGALAWRAQRSAKNSPALAVRSLAVLPFENLSGDPSQDYFADSMTDELITNLGQISSLRVISRTSIMQYKGTHKALPQIARELNVEAIVEGTLMRSGDHMRITAQLIYAPRDGHLWAHSYESEVRDVLKLQAQIADAIASEIRTTLGPVQRTLGAVLPSVKPEAYDAYLKGYYEQRSVDGLKRRIAYFQQATDLQPDFAAAYVETAKAYVNLGHMLELPPGDAFPEAELAAAKALQLDDTLAEAHAALGNVEFLHRWDFSAAEREFRRAVQLNPSSLYAQNCYIDFLSAMGRHEEAIARARQSQRLDPLALSTITELAETLYFAGRYDEALVQTRRALGANPNLVTAHLWSGLALEQKHEFASAIAELQESIRLSHNPTWIGFVAHARALSGDKASARQVLGQMQTASQKTYVSPWWPGMIYPDLGDEEQAFVWLEKCYHGREHDLAFSKAWPMFNRLRSDPRYQDLMRRVDLPQ